MFSKNSHSAEITQDEWVDERKNDGVTGGRL